MDLSRDRLLSLTVRWLILALAVWIAAEVVPGIHLEGLKSTLIVALILGLLNLYVRPILFFFTLPLTIVTLGLFLILLNAIMLGLTSWIASWFDSISFHVDDIGSAILGAIIVSLVSMILGHFIKPEQISDRQGRAY